MSNLGKRILKITAKSLAFVFLFILIYGAAVYFIPKISIDRLESNNSEIEIFIKTNGVHTDIVVPIKNDVFDWNGLISSKNTLSKHDSYKYVGIGWGNKGFYLETPTWADLKVSTAFNAAFGLSETAIHATFYDSLVENIQTKRLFIDKAQYLKLVGFIKNTLLLNNLQQSHFIETTAVYGNNDVFYNAVGRYHLFQTCNTWANDALKAAGQKACLWTATDFGIFNLYQ